MPLFKKQPWIAAQMKPNKVFGAPIETFTNVPDVVNITIGYLVKKGLQLEGIFRISGNASEIEKLVKLYSKGKSVDHSKLKSDPHAVAGVLKLWFRMLPTPLLTYDLFPDFMEAAEDPNFVTRVTKYKDIIRKLPKVNGLILERLVGLLCRVWGYSRVNKMNSHNLAIVFGPNLLVREVPLMDPRKAMAESETINKVSETLIEQFDFLYRGKKPKPPEGVDQATVDANFQETHSSVVVISSSVEKKVHSSPISHKGPVPEAFSNAAQERNRTLRGSSQINQNDPKQFFANFKFARFLDNKILKKFTTIPDPPTHIFSKKIIEADDPLDDDIETWDFEEPKPINVHLPQLTWVDAWEPIPLPDHFRDENAVHMDFGGFSLVENPPKREYPAVEGIEVRCETRKKLDEMFDLGPNMNPTPLPKLDLPEDVDESTFQLPDLKVAIDHSDFLENLKSSNSYITSMDNLFDKALLADFPGNMVIHTNIYPESIRPILFPIPTKDKFSVDSVPVAQYQLQQKLKGELGSKIPTEEELEAHRQKIAAARQANIERERQAEFKKASAPSSSEKSATSDLGDSPPPKSASSPRTPPPASKPKAAPPRAKTASKPKSPASSESPTSKPRSPSAGRRRGRGGSGIKRAGRRRGSGVSSRGPSQLGDIIGAQASLGAKPSRGTAARRSSKRRGGKKHAPKKSLADLP